MQIIKKLLKSNTLFYKKILHYICTKTFNMAKSPFQIFTFPYYYLGQGTHALNEALPNLGKEIILSICHLPENSLTG